MVVWTAVGALATVAGALFGYLELQDDESPRSEGRKAADPKQDVKRSPAPAALPRTKILLRNKYSQLCADVVGTGSETHNNTPVQQWGCEDTGDNQLWRLEKSETRGPKGRPLFQIVNAVNSQCMDLPDLTERRPGRSSLKPLAPQRLRTTSCGGAKKGGCLLDPQCRRRRPVPGCECIDKKPGDSLAIYHCIKGDDQAWAMANVVSKNSRR